MRKKIIAQTSVGILLAAALLCARPAVAFYNQSEADGCAGCHYPSGAHMKPVVDKWKAGPHSRTFGRIQGNTFCARCHAPFEADPGASYMNNSPVKLEDWQSVTCGVCHPPYPRPSVIARYDVDTGEYVPLDLADADELCVGCHSGERHRVEFGKIGRKCVEKGGARCIDCHMPKVPWSSDPSVPMRASHDFKVEGNLPYSCGVNGTGCHGGRDVQWAIRKIARWEIHKWAGEAK